MLETIADNKYNKRLKAAEYLRKHAAGAPTAAYVPPNPSEELH